MRGDREDRDARRQPWGPRILAPLAFFAAATVLIVIVQGALNSEESAAPTSSPPAAGTARDTTTARTATGETPRANRRFYRIQDGDTLEAIAERFNTTVEDLLALNPGIDANALTPGRRIRVR
jgi:LysM repeat protein